MVWAASQLEVRRVVLRHVRVPLVEPFRISSGAVSEKDAVLVELQAVEHATGRTVTGWGEASPMAGSFYSADTPESAWRALRDVLIPLAFAQLVEPPRFFAHLHAAPGECFAKAGLEGAAWDAGAQLHGAPLCELLGGRARPVPSGVAIGIFDTIEELLERVSRYAAEGYRRVKIKIQPGWDIEPVRVIRERFPQLPLMVDANAAYTVADAAVFRELDRFGLMMFEQPLARNAHDESAELARQVTTPICADESAESMEALECLIAKRAARIVNIKVQRVGGLSEACRMLNRARSAGLDCWVGTMPELGVASAQGLHFATLDGFAYPSDIEASSRWYTDDLVEPPITIDASGYIHLPAGPGSGYAVSPEKVERYTIACQEFAN